MRALLALVVLTACASDPMIEVTKCANLVDGECCYKVVEPKEQQGNYCIRKLK